MYSNATMPAVSKPSARKIVGSYTPYFFLMLGFSILVMFITGISLSVARAEDFTQIFYTNSFRGAFTWIQKLDWVGMIVQCVISCFSLFGVALMTIRIMTSMLYLSAKGMWEEVHDLKNVGGESEKDFIGLFGMAKSWAKGKSGTGLDALIGAVLMLLPDVKKYSDFGDKSGQKFEQDTTITQYILKIALPTVMTVFFFAMGFNGTLFKALAVTVDFMGTIADRAVSVNYAGFVDDLVNSNLGYKFVFVNSGTNTGKLQQSVAKDLYGRCVSMVKDANADQLFRIGQNVESWVTANVTPAACAESISVNENLKTGLRGEGDGENNADAYMAYMGYDLVVNGSTSANGAVTVKLDDLITGAQSGDGNSEMGDSVQEVGTVAGVAGAREQYAHMFLRQTTNFNRNYFNLDGVSSGVSE